MEVQNIKATVSINLEYGEFSIRVSNTHDRKLHWNVFEQSNKGSVEVSHKASNFIIEDFKKTEEYKNIIDVIREATKDYGY